MLKTYIISVDSNLQSSEPRDGKFPISTAILVVTTLNRKGHNFLGFFVVHHFGQEAKIRERWQRVRKILTAHTLLDVQSALT